MIGFSTKSFGQPSNYLSIQYAVSFATGDLDEFISKASWRGILVEYRAAVNENLYAGLDAGWNVFYEKKDYDTYTLDTRSLSGIQYRYQNSVPLLASADYQITSGSPLKPYLGLGIGTIYSERAIDMNLYRWEETTWQFALKGELGVLYDFSFHSSLKFAAKFYNGFKTETLDNQGYFSLSLGMLWSL
jgi:outer membrane protein